MEQHPRKEPDIIGNVHRPPVERPDPTGLENFGPEGGSHKAIEAANADHSKEEAGA